MIKGLVSVITPAYNAEMYLKKYFDSLYEQTYKNIEIIIVNDGSEDNTENEIKKYIEKFKVLNINVIYKYQTNSGQAAAINNALKEVNGEFLYWQDVDDFCEKDGIENMVSFLNSNKEYNIVRGKVRFWKNGEILKVAGPKNIKKEKIFNQYIFCKGVYCFPGIFMVRMSFFDLNILDRKIYESREGQNWQLILPNTYSVNCGFVNKVVYNYNVIENSHSHVIRSKEALIKRNKGLCDIIINTLKSIKRMNVFIKMIYLIIIKIKYECLVQKVYFINTKFGNALKKLKNKLRG